MGFTWAALGVKSELNMKTSREIKVKKEALLRISFGMKLSNGTLIVGFNIF